MENSRKINSQDRRGSTRKKLRRSLKHFLSSHWFSMLAMHIEIELKELKHVSKLYGYLFCDVLAKPDPYVLTECQH